MADEPFTGLSDDGIQRAAVGEAPVLDDRVTLAEYDPRWPELYAREERRIRAALGDRVFRIEHIGSTSVPGLVAKPIIDIVLLVQDSADENGYVP
ncbi:MAG: cyclopropane fatty acid synthase, partial [Streptosporangiales bacterium]|nr:cyclopropane fatty acid synthase [Streptosporangiales bacterium]